MLSHRIRRKLERLWQAIGTWVLGVTGVLALGALWYYLATAGPARVDEDVPVEITFDDPRLDAMAREVGGLEKQYQVFETAGAVNAEAIALLVNAVEKQRQLVRSLAKEDYVQQDKLIQLEKALDTARAGEKVVRIEQLTREGEEAQAANRLTEAETLYKEALKLQREVNSGGAAPKFKNYVRETSLEQSIVSLAAYPLHLEKTAALERAATAMKEERWTDALAAYTVAREALEKLNREYARTRYSDTATLARVVAEIESLNAAGLASRVDEQEKAGERAEAILDHEAATRAFVTALAAQQEINRDFPRSRFVSSARIDTLEVKLQTAKSRPLAAQLEALELAIREDLRRRRVVAAEQKLPQASELTAKLAAEYPRSRHVDGALRIRLSYLALKSADLRKMQDDVYDRLLPLPGAEERLMMVCEVPQTLYTLVMNTNPSRNPGRLMPVDSVNWNDATEFCTRLGWVLGLKARMPTLDEYRVAVGGGGGEARSAANGGRPGSVDTAKPNEAGFRDLVGNLGEWLDAAERDDKAPVAGGSYLDTAEQLLKAPTELRAKVDRARHVGFRIVVETGR